MYKDKNKKTGKGNAVLNEKNLIKKMLFCFFTIIPGIIMLYFKNYGLIIPGLLLTFFGFILFLTLIFLNISRINSYQENNIFNDD